MNNLRSLRKLTAIVVLISLVLMLVLNSSGAVSEPAAAAGEGAGFYTYPLIGKRLAGDPQEHDNFGSGVALDGNTLVVGALWEDGGPGDPIENAGAVYIFEKDQGGPDNWGQAAKLTVPGAQPWDLLGLSVGISGDTLVAGAMGAGKAYIFERDLNGADAWGLSKTLIPDPQAMGDFGRSVAISQDTIVVGASSYDLIGAAFVFERDLGGPDNWGQAKILVPSGTTTFEEVGRSVGISIDTIVLGAPGHNNGGAAWVFERELGGSDAWGESAKLTAGDPTHGDEFGGSVDIDGDTIVVGAESEGGGPGDPLPFSGAVYVFERDQGGSDAWGQTAKLAAGDPANNDQFGTSVSIDAERIVVGAVPKDSAYVFRSGLNGPDSWIQTSKLNSGGQDGERFGNAVAAGGATLVIGAENSSDSPDPFSGSDVGAVYLFREIFAIEAQFLPMVSSCYLHYYDDFSDPGSGWPVADLAGALYAYLNGEYRVLVKNPFGFAGAIPGAGFSNYLLSAEVRNIANRDGSYGLLFGQVTDFTGFYTFEIDRNQNYWIWRWNGAWTLLDSGFSAAINPGSAVNSLAIERSGGSIKAYVNQVLVSSLFDFTFTGLRNVGVSVKGGAEANLDVRFDEYKVAPIVCGFTAPSTPAEADPLSPSEALPSSPAWLEAGFPERGD